MIFVLDVEATCWDKDCAEDTEIFSRQESEIIEFGMVLVEKQNSKIIDKFNSFIKPQRRPILSNFCKNLTSISQSDVDNAKTYIEVCKELKQFLDKYPNVKEWSSWGNYDNNIITENCLYWNIENPFKDFMHINLKDKLKEKYPDYAKKHKRLGCEKTLRKCFRLEFDGTQHRGIDDAINISKMVQFLF